MSIEEAIVGRKVIYTPFKGCRDNMRELGWITSKNDKYVFVRYGTDNFSKSTNPEDLEYC